MKAWTVFCGDVVDGAVLVFAETRNRARQLGVGAWPGNWYYMDVSAKRARAWDGLRQGEDCIVDESDMPAAWPRFFWDDVL